MDFERRVGFENRLGQERLDCYPDKNQKEDKQYDFPAAQDDVDIVGQVSFFFEADGILGVFLVRHKIPGCGMNDEGRENL